MKNWFKHFATFVAGGALAGAAYYVPQEKAIARREVELQREKQLLMEELRKG
ncbi:MAG: hypothetical protein O8C64_09470 [Candidatus Methanoperedens sp.]|nr:hypothetical protein [Candidatus Methanoperedens sp.]